MATTYHYTARTLQGGRVSGTMQAEQAEDVIAHLRTRALFITSVTPARSAAGRAAELRLPGPIPLPQLLMCLRSFATLTRAGVSVSRSLHVMIAQCGDPRLRESLSAILADIEQGRSLSAALRRRPREFSALHIAMIEAGEAGGMLDDVLERLAGMVRAEHEMRKKMSSALAYPLIVLGASLALVVFLLSTLLPLFGRLFEQLGVEEPAGTRFLLLLAATLQQPPFWSSLLLLFVSAIALFSARRSDPAFALALDRALLRVPLLGTLRRTIAMARISRMLGSLLHAGVDVLRAIDVTAPVAGSAVYAADLRELRDALRNGDAIADQLERSRHFDSMLLQMIRVGEETGTLDAMLLEAAEHYDADLETMTATLNAVLEPTLILIVGSIVGCIVFSVFVPMYSLVSQIK